MPDTTAPEPTMEEILASIRRIISEDEAPAASAPAEATAPAGDPPRPAEPEDAAPPAPAAKEEVLELTDRFEPEPPTPAAAPATAAPPPSPPGDLDFAAAPPPPSPPETPRPFQTSAPAPAPAPSPIRSSYTPPAHDEPLVSATSADRAADHFSALTSTLSMPAPGRTLEDVTRELLRPLLKEWLDQNLARIVEERVQDEVERISRRRPS